MLNWMAWTAPTAAVFVAIAVVLIGMTVWGRFSPPVPHRGFLGMETDRTDRLYVACLTVLAFLVLWMALSDASMWPALAVGGVIGGIVMRWG